MKKKYSNYAFAKYIAECEKLHHSPASMMFYDIASKGNDPEALYEVANAYAESKNYDKAEQYYNKAIKRGYHLAHVGLAKLYLLDDKIDLIAAEQHLKIAIKYHLEPAYACYAKMIKKHQKYFGKNAASKYFKLIATGCNIEKSNSGECLSLFAETCQAIDQFDDALDALVKAITLGFEKAKKYYAVTVLDNKLEKYYEQAINYLIEYSSNDYHDADLLLARLFIDNKIVKRNEEIATFYYFQCVMNDDVDGIIDFLGRILSNSIKNEHAKDFLNELADKLSKLELNDKQIKKINKMQNKFPDSLDWSNFFDSVSDA